MLKRAVMLVFYIVFGYINPVAAFTMSPAGATPESPVTFTMDAGELSSCTNWYMEMSGTGTYDSQVQATSTDSWTFTCGDNLQEEGFGVLPFTCPLHVSAQTIEAVCTSDTVGSWPSTFDSFTGINNEAFDITSSTTPGSSTSTSATDVEVRDFISIMQLAVLVGIFCAILWPRSSIKR